MRTRLVLAVMWLAGCYGEAKLLVLHDDGDGEVLPTPPDVSGPAEPSDPDAPPSLCAHPNRPGRGGIHRLSRTEYGNTLVDLLRAAPGTERTLPPDAELHGFDNNIDVQGVSQLHVESWLAVAEQLAATAVRDLPALLGCSLDADETGCSRRFVETFGARAFRRPLEADEVTRYVELYVNGWRTYWHPTWAPPSKATRAGAVLEAMLQSPHFLYRVEVGGTPAAEPGVVKPSPFEMASRLSYLLWGSMPDAALFAAAAAGELGTRAQLEAQARRMLADGRGHTRVRDFHLRWWKVHDLEGLAPRADAADRPELRTYWKEEAGRMVDDVVWSPGGDHLRRLLTTTRGFANAPLAALYGVQGPTGTALVPVTLDPARRSGLVTHGGLMALLAKPTETAPIARGLFVREQLLCQTVSAPPPDVPIDVPPVTPGSTTRERYEVHRSNPACAGCHDRLDLVGFGFEHYDALGRWRDVEEGKPIDATGELKGTRDADGPFDGAIELAARLGRSEEVADCVTTQWFRFAYGREESALADACTLEQLRARFRASGRSVPELVVALTQTPAFLYREAP